MRVEEFVEYGTPRPVALTPRQLQQLQTVAGRDTSVTPNPAAPGVFDVSAGVVGGMLLDDLQIRIRPRFGIRSTMFMIAYSLDSSGWRDLFPFAVEGDVVDAVAPAFLHHVRYALQRGILQGYQTVEEALPTVRGRILFDEQLRRRSGRWLPVQVRYDEYTIDIAENRLLLAALDRLRRVRLRSEVVRRGLREQEAALAGVSLIAFNSSRIPTIAYTRLNKRYEHAIALARLVLESTSIDIGAGRAPACAFLVRMSRVFELFVVTALREALGARTSHLVHGGRGRQLTMGIAGEIQLWPDLSWWDGSQCRFVADIKYKSAAHIRHAQPGDLYQLLAYATSANVPSGMLIHAAGGVDTSGIVTRHSGKVLHSLAIDLSTSPDRILEQVRELARRIERESERAAAA
jgi:5-methylcytosine-specific restriction enzyme subunit McrC